MKKEFCLHGIPITKLPPGKYYFCFWDLEQLPVPEAINQFIDAMPEEILSKYIQYQKDKNLIPAFHDIPYCNIIEI